MAMQDIEKEKDWYYADWNFEIFFHNLKELGDVEANIVLNVLKLMEHGLNFKDVENRYGIEIARTEKRYTQKELIEKVEKKTGENIENTFKAMLKKNYKNSLCLKHTLEVLDIDEDFLIQNSEHFNIDMRGKDEAEIEQETINLLKHWFDTLSNNDRKAICYLVYALLDKEGIKQFLKNFKEMQRLTNEGNPEDFMPNVGVKVDGNIPCE